MGLYTSPSPQAAVPLPLLSLNISDSAHIKRLNDGILSFPDSAPSAHISEPVEPSTSGSSSTSSEGSRTASISRTRSIFSRTDSVKTTLKRPIAPGAVFGAPLEQTLEAAGTFLSSHDLQGERLAIPIIVEECGRFILSKEEEASADFIPGDSVRVEILRQSLGSGYSNIPLVWATCNTQDASSLLCAYLYSLPEPVIPVHFYQAFRAPLQIKSGSTLDTTAVVSIYQSLISQLPIAHRHLLLHLLDLFATLRAQNRFKLRNILAIRAAPAILRSSTSPSRFGRKMRELLLAGDDSVPVLMFLIRNQMHFAVVEDEEDDGEMEEATLVSVVGASRQCVQVVNVQKREG